MFKLLLAFSMVMALSIGQNTEECSEITLDECAEGLPFETLKGITPESCQTDWCDKIFAGICTFFIYV